MIPVVTVATKWKIDKFDCIKIYNMCIENDVRNKVKRYGFQFGNMNNKKR